MANKFLSESGLKTLWSKICSKVTTYTLEKDDDWKIFEDAGKSKNVDDFATLTLKGSDNTEQPVEFHMCAISGMLSDDSIDGGILKNNCISTDKIADSAVTETKIKDGAVTESKLASDVKNKLTGKTEEYTPNGEDKEFSVTWDVPFFVYATDDEYSLYFALCITNGENFQITDMSGEYAGNITMKVSADNLIVRNATNIKIWYLH